MFEVCSEPGNSFGVGGSWWGSVTGKINPTTTTHHILWWRKKVLPGSGLVPGPRQGKKHKKDKKDKKEKKEKDKKDKKDKAPAQPLFLFACLPDFFPAHGPVPGPVPALVPAPVPAPVPVVPRSVGRRDNWLMVKIQLK